MIEFLFSASVVAILCGALADAFPRKSSTNTILSWVGICGILGFFYTAWWWLVVTL